LSYSRKKPNTSPLKNSKLQNLVEGEGFEPSYSERADLQSAAFNRSATPPFKERAIIQITTRLVKGNQRNFQQEAGQPDSFRLKNLDLLR
jgi:hypothetical protein